MASFPGYKRNPDYVGFAPDSLATSSMEGRQAWQSPDPEAWPSFLARQGFLLPTTPPSQSTWDQRHNAFKKGKSRFKARPSPTSVAVPGPPPAQPKPVQPPASGGASDPQVVPVGPPSPPAAIAPAQPDHAAPVVVFMDV